jgi:hypothetical protein
VSPMVDSILTYAQALEWISENEDCDWLDYDFAPVADTASLMAAIYVIGIDQVVRDLREMRKDGR